MILQEISLNHELANLQKFSDTYKDSGIKFPKLMLIFVVMML